MNLLLFQSLFGLFGFAFGFKRESTSYFQDRFGLRLRQLIIQGDKSIRQNLFQSHRMTLVNIFFSTFDFVLFSIFQRVWKNTSIINAREHFLQE